MLYHIIRGNVINLEMMVTFGGKERTEQEFATLLRSAGLCLEPGTPIHGSCFFGVEATPACRPTGKRLIRTHKVMRASMKKQKAQSF